MNNSFRLAACYDDIVSTAQSGAIVTQIRNATSLPLDSDNRKLITSQRLLPKIL